MEKYKLTVGLEVHAELKTLTKMFCACKNDPDEHAPNINICPICLGHPGILPVINKRAIRHVLSVGVAIEGALADFSEFDRKNYFYPDIPKGYQISQYKYPLVSGGELAGVKITRVHLEEDTARSSHESGDFSLVDFNRAGVPLMELVTEPVIKSAKEAGNFAKELQLLLQYLGVAGANMEKGELRVEANISVSDSEKFGTKVEVKNLNSFRLVERAINFEFERQAKILEDGGEVVQETRGWDENRGETFSQRRKEDSHDYRYFPDPDLPKLKLSDLAEFSSNVLLREMPETPEKKRERYAKYGLKDSDIEFYVGNKEFADLFEKASTDLEGDQLQLLSNYIVTDLAGIGEKALGIAHTHLGVLIQMIGRGELSSRGAKAVLVKMIETGREPRILAEESDLLQKSDTEFLHGMITKVLEANPRIVAEYKTGKTNAAQFLIGQCMKESKGSANPELLKNLVEKALK